MLEEAGDEFNAVLKRIDEDGLMAPIQVIQTLSSNAVATMGTVKKYLSETIEKERKEISNVTIPNRHLSRALMFRQGLIDSRTAASSRATVQRPMPSEKR